jgi:hypothetical protein
MKLKRIVEFCAFGSVCVSLLLYGSNNSRINEEFLFGSFSALTMSCQNKVANGVFPELPT